ncbi:MAG: hypothetical protein PHQ57_00005, partial [Candidatus Omnitrophica bacterium]|nr:hypothetical protein [Candidatus Omnitrophota bacterium]
MKNNSEREDKMKLSAMLVLVAVLLLPGCEYECPLVGEHSISIDSSLLGLWDSVRGGGDEADAHQQMMILKFSDSEYLIHYPTKDGLYYRGYPIEIGGVPCVQLEVIGIKDGLPDKNEKRLFHVVSYSLIKGELEVKTLNTDLVS